MSNSKVIVAWCTRFISMEIINKSPNRMLNIWLMRYGEKPTLGLGYINNSQIIPIHYLFIKLICMAKDSFKYLKAMHCVLRKMPISTYMIIFNKISRRFGNSNIKPLRVSRIYFQILIQKEFFFNF